MIPCVYLWARSEEPGAVLSFHVNLQDESGKRLDRHSASCTVTAEWKEYIMQLPKKKKVNWPASCPYRAPPPRIRVYFWTTLNGSLALPMRLRRLNLLMEQY